jgi:Domain of unknown function (DUF4167)
MRPNQNKRMRGRNSSPRKGPNPLSRTYESNGPDVKIRGTAHHIGEKYLQLARDAQSSGDPVMAESFLQHAEHYFRLIAAAQAAQQQSSQGYQRQAGEAEAEELEEEDDFVGGMDRFASPLERSAPQQSNFAGNGSQPPYPERSERPERASYNNGERQPYERPERGPRPERNFQERNYQDRNFGDRNGQERPSQERGYQDRSYGERNFQDRSSQERNGQDRNGQERNGQERNGQERQSSGREMEPRGRRRNDREFRGENGSRYERSEPRAVEEIDGNKGLPAFITSPVRIQAEPHLTAMEDQPAAEIIDRQEGDAEASGFHLRPRRRRRKNELGEGQADVNPARDPVGD